MKSIKLKSLALSNFKGIRDLTIDFSDRTDISGDNATGKTTIFDAFTWLLFDKDSLNRSSFGIKTFEPSGAVLHGLEHVVEGVLEVDGKRITLKKIYKENWVKKRGRTDQEFDGHTTDYFFNEVPVKKTEYDTRIQSIIPEDQFKLLTNPHHFNEILDWKKRREIILGLEEVTDEDVLNAMSDRPSELEELMKIYTLDEIRAMTTQSMRKINKDIQELPIRISELNNQITTVDTKALRAKKKEIQAELDLISGQDADIQTMLATLKAKSKMITDLKADLRKMEEENNEANRLREREAKKSIEEYEDTLNDLQRKVVYISQDIKDREARRDVLSDRLREARELYREINRREVPEGERCQTCGQDLPEEQTAKKIAEFNVRKSEELEAVAKQGSDLAAEVEKLTEIVKEKDKELTLVKEQIESLEGQKPETAKVEQIVLGEDYYKLKEDIKSLEEDLMHTEDVPSESELRAKRQELQGRLSAIDEDLGATKRNTQLKERIKELKAEEKALSSSYLDQEKILYQLDEFTKTKAETVSAAVNGNFDHITFKLFDIQINGGVVEVCEALIDGVPYGDANNAAKINAGLDVINTLAKVYETIAPVFIDNAESVNQLTDTDSQMIRLIVSKDKELRVS
jgi:exonuclease SbcC